MDVRLIQVPPENRSAADMAVPLGEIWKKQKNRMRAEKPVISGYWLILLII